jgi:hypothetical protein
MKKLLPRIIGTLSAGTVSFAALFLMELFAEVTDDGLPLSGRTGVSSLLLAIAPMTPVPHLAAILVAALYWSESRLSEPTAIHLISLVSVALFGLTALAVGGDVYKRYAYLDGGRSPTPSIWIASAVLIVGLSFATYRSWIRRAEPTGCGDDGKSSK